MIYITGDTHGCFDRLASFNENIRPSADDVMIILGDAGLNYHRNEKDTSNKQIVSSFPFVTFCIHGNHECRPEDIGTYKLKEYRGGLVWYEEEYPNILFAKDGEVYDFEGYTCLVIGGAYSVDKSFRIIYGLPWFINEQPSEEIKKQVEEKLSKLGSKVDIILSHTCPLKYEPKEVFLKGINQLLVDKTTENWLDEIEASTDYSRWFCGHFHTSKRIDKLQFLFEDIIELK